MAQEQTYPIEKIILDDYFKVRPLNREKVEEYKEQKRNGDIFPAIVLWHESGSGKVYLVAGAHRLTADKELGRADILAIFMNFPSKIDALFFAIADNAKHGLPFTPSERRAMVERLLQDPEGGARSDRQIARSCHVAHSTVGRIREELVSGGRLNHVDERIGTDGKTYTIREHSTPKWWGKGGKIFFAEVKRLGLSETIPIYKLLDVAEPGVKKPSEFTVDKETAWKNLAAFATERTAKLFPVGSIVKYTRVNGFGEITTARAGLCNLMDLPSGVGMTMYISEFTLSSQRAYEAWQKKSEVNAQPPAPMTDTERQMNADLAADLTALHPSKPAPTEPARTPTFADGALVKVIKTGKAGRVLKTLWEGGLHEKCHLELPSTDERGKSYNTYYWYMAEELTLIEPSTNGSQSPVSSSPVIDEWAGDSNADPTPPSSPIGDSERSLSIDDFAPRPWAVEKRPAVYLITDRRGTPLVSTMSIGGEHTDIAYALVRAVNAHRDYTSQQVRDILPSLRRILDFADGMIPAPDTLAEDIFEVQTLLAHLRRTIARNEPSPEAVAP